MAVLAELTVTGRVVVLREAAADDVPAIVALFADDAVGVARDGVRDDEPLTPYLAALETLDADSAHLVVVADLAGEVVGTFQLSVLPGLSRRGATRAQIEGVHVAAAHRGGGLGAAMMRWAVEESRRRGCSLVQLTSDKHRPAAHRFYDRLGFVASHEGFKLTLG